MAKKSPEVARPKDDLQVARLLSTGTAGDYRFELWRMPHNKVHEKFVVIAYLCGTEINRHPYPTEVRAREEMEQMTFRHTAE